MRTPVVRGRLRPRLGAAALTLLLVAQTLAGAAAARPAATVPLPPAERWGVAVRGDGDVVRFARPFVGTPVVLVSAQRAGRAVAAAAVDVDPRAFRLSLRDRANRPVAGAWVQWVAVAPDLAVGVLGGVADVGDGGRVTFPFPFADPPVVVVNARADGRAVVGGVPARDRRGFDVSLRGVNGAPLPLARVTWLAVDPAAANGFAAGEAPGRDGADVAFAPPFRDGPAYVLSAAPAAPVAAVDNRHDGFRLSLAPPGDAPASPPTVQWLGFAGTTGGDSETTAAMPGARLVVRARWQGAEPEATLAVCFALSNRPDGRSPFDLRCVTAGQPAVAFRLPALASGGLVWVVEVAPPGWVVAGENPLALDVPAPAETREVVFTNIPGAAAPPATPGP